MTRGSTDIEMSDTVSQSMRETEEFYIGGIGFGYGTQLSLVGFDFLDFMIQVNSKDDVRMAFRGNMCNIH